MKNSIHKVSSKLNSNNGESWLSTISNYLQKKGYLPATKYAYPTTISEKRYSVGKGLGGDYGDAIIGEADDFREAEQIAGDLGRIYDNVHNVYYELKSRQILKENLDPMETEEDRYRTVREWIAKKLPGKNKQFQELPPELRIINAET